MVAVFLPLFLAASAPSCQPRYEFAITAEVAGDYASPGAGTSVLDGIHSETVDDSGTPVSTLVNNDATLSLSGVCDTDTTIMVEGDFTDTTPCTLGAYSLEFTAGADGRYIFTVYQQDAGGDRFGLVRVDWTYDTVAPDAPDLDAPILFASETEAAVTGSCESGAVVQVINEDLEVAGETACTDAGTFATSVSEEIYGEYAYEVIQTDPAGNPSDGAALSWVRTAAGIAAPSISSPASPLLGNTSPVVVEGYCATGATVTASLDGVEAASTACDGTSFSLSLSNAGDGTYTYEFIQSKAGADSEATEWTWTLDQSVPTAPAITSPASSPWYGTETELTLEGSCETDATVSLSGDGTASATCTDGAFSFGLSTSTDGTLNYSLTQTDAVGNESSATSFTWTRDTTAPADPTLSTPASSPHYGHASPLSVSGGCEYPGTVEISGDVSDSVSCTSGGTWSTSLTQATEGTLAVTFTGRDLTGNTSSGISLSWTYDVTAPSVPTVTTPATSSVTTTTDSITIAGACEADASIEVSGDASTTATCAGDGSFSFDLEAATDGTRTYTLKQRDLAGNLSASGVTITWTRDTTAPAAPVVTLPASSPHSDTATSLTISGTCEADATVNITGAESSAVTCSGAGTFSFDASQSDTGIYAYEFGQTDAAGNASASTASFTWRRPVGPVNFTVTPVYRTYATVNWETDAGASGYRVSLTQGATTTTTTVSGASSSSTTLTGLSKNTAYSVLVNALDSQGNPDTNSTPVNFTTLSDFAGITGVGITQASPSTATISWTPHAEADSYEIFDVTSGSPVSVATVNGAASSSSSVSIDASIQRTCVQVTFRVRATYKAASPSVDADTNTTDLSTYTAGPASTEHAGWTKLLADGPIVEFNGSTSTVGKVTLKWSDMTPGLSSGSITGWHIFRSTSAGITDYSTPLATVTNNTTRTYVDNSVSEGTTYYYQVRPYLNQGSAPQCQIPVGTTNHPREVKMPVPPRNMVLVHRWMANKTICAELQQSSNPTVYPLDNYSCAFNSLGAAPPAGYNITTTSGRYDFGYNLAVDKWELGCNYTHSGSNNCNNGTTGCLFDSDGYTGSNAAVGNVIYTRHNGTCQVKYTTTGADNFAITATIDEAFNTQAGDSSIQSVRSNMLSNARYLPPIANVDQASAAAACGTFSAPSGYADTSKRLLMRREQVVAAAWDSAALTTTQIGTMEAGSTDFTATSACNTNRASATQGITEGTVAQWAAGTVNADSLPYVASSGARVVRTGSTATASCTSAFGIQDTVGNVEEWLSDQFAGKSLSDPSCTTSKWYGQTSTVDSNNTYLSNYSLSETSTGTSNGLGPAWTQTAVGVVQTFTYLKVKNADVNANLAAGSTTHTTMGWNPALGTLQLYPSEASMASAGVLEILGNNGTQVTGNGGNPIEIVGLNYFNDDKIYVAGSAGAATCSAAHTTARGLTAGGKANYTSSSTPIAAPDVGRWFFNLSNTVTTKGQAIGARCALRID